jgi:secreted trypsin-like serine protease
MGFGLTEDPVNQTWIGHANSQFLRQVGVTVLAQDSESCARVYAGGWGCSDAASEAAAENLDMQICAGSVGGSNRDACAGDSGSPVVDAYGMQVAVISYGGGPGMKMTGSGRICGDPDYPGVYARVSAFSDFILQNVDDLPASDTFLSIIDSGDETYNPALYWRPISHHHHHHLRR